MPETDKIIILKMGDLSRYSHPDYDKLIIDATTLPEIHFLVCNGTSINLSLPDPENIKAVIISGSSLMLTDDHRWKNEISNWLISIISKKIPVLGICFGHQLLALALGGKVGNNPKGIELGSRSVKLTESGKDDILLRDLYPAFLAQESHVQSVLQPPEGTVILAYNDHDFCQAFRYGQNVWGIQFHPEFDLEIMQKIIQHKIADKIYDIDANTIIADLQETPESYGILNKFAEIVIKNH
jgi:GMP synthase (glutamine-hydrolysing)